jgi:hypothetical protein
MIEYAEADYGGATVPTSVRSNQFNDRQSSLSATPSSVFSWRPKSAVGANGIRNQLANMKKNKYIKAKKVLKKPKDARS